MNSYSANEIWRRPHRFDTGRWIESGFPRTGWRFSCIEDVGEDGVTCGVCLNAKVRYAHQMIHGDEPGVLAVGLKCAELLQDDFYRPEKREREFRTDLRIADDWPNAIWKVSRLGNWYVNRRGFNIAIWDKGGAGFGVTIKLQNKFDGSFEVNGRKLYTTLDQAKRGALEALLYARRKFRAEDTGR